MTEAVKPFVWCELVCRTCSCTTSGNFWRGRVTAKVVAEMVKDARKARWQFEDNEPFCSQHCFNKYKENP